MSLARLSILQFGRVYAVALLRFLTAFALAAFIEPVWFGWIALVAFPVSILWNFVEWGAKAIVIQQGDEETDLSLPFSLAVYSAIPVSLLSVLIGWVESQWFGRGELFTLGMYFGSATLAYAVGVPAYAWFHKHMRFNELAIIDGLVQLAASAVALSFAWRNQPFAAVVAFFIVPTALHALIAFARFLVTAKTQLYLIPPGSELFGWVQKTRSVAVASTLESGSAKIDSLLIGFLFGAGNLGLYNRAYSIAHYPAQLTSGVINPVLYPYSQKHGLVDALTPANLKSVLIPALTAVLAGLFILAWSAPSWIAYFWGDEWIGVAPLMYGLSLVAVGRMLSKLSEIVILNREKQHWLFRIQLFLLIGMIAILAITAPFGLMVVTYSLGVFYVLAAAVMIDIIGVKLLKAGALAAHILFFTGLSILPLIVMISTVFQTISLLGLVCLSGVSLVVIGLQLLYFRKVAYSPKAPES